MLNGECSLLLYRFRVATDDSLSEGGCCNNGTIEKLPESYVETNYDNKNAYDDYDVAVSIR